jgi:DNA-binding transcriptional regulator YiaG
MTLSFPPSGRSPYGGLRKPPKARIKPVDVAKLRDRLGMTQQAFGWAFGFSPKSVANWEQGIRTPDKSAQAYLMAISRHASAIYKTLIVTSKP